MALSNVAIKNMINQGDLKISPLAEDSIRPASICLHMSDKILIFPPQQTIIDPTNPDTYPSAKQLILSQEQGYNLAPNEFLLASTLESVGLSKKITGYISNISGLARLGVTVALSTHVAPGFGELAPRPLTLEIYNSSQFTIKIKPDIRICHLILHSATPPSSKGYDELFPKKYLAPPPTGSQFCE